MRAFSPKVWYHTGRDAGSAPVIPKERKLAMVRDLTLLVDGREAFPEIIDCIDRAAESIHINMFIWRDDSIGNRVARAVLKAAERGVRVFLSVDRYGLVLEKSEESKKSFFHKTLTLTERAKIRTLELLYPMPGAPRRAEDERTELYRAIMAHPNITVSADVFKADHSKYYIIDGKTLILGGINIEDKENGQDLQGRVYQDYMVKLEGRAYVDALRAKLGQGTDLSSDWSFGVNCRESRPRRFEVEGRYLDMIRTAEEELHITMAYFSPLSRFLQAIADAHRRGVKVTVMLPAGANYQNDSNRLTARRLLEWTDNGICLYLSPKMLHTKLIVTEKQISLGSANITKKAFRQLSELNLFLKNTDGPLTRRLFASMEENYAAARRVTSFREIGYNPLLARMEQFLV